MTDAPNRPPLWRVMKKAWETTTTDLDGSYAAEIRAVRDWLKGQLPEGGAWHVLLTAEAERAERGK
jgi:hypothetical protein